MLRPRALLAAMVIPLSWSPAVADPFSGLAAGLGAASHSLQMDAQFDHDGSTSSESVSKAGPMADLGYGFMVSPTVHVQGGVRAYRVELEANLYPDDCVKAERHVAAYGQVGYVFGAANMVYGLLEGGRADVLLATEGYPTENFDSKTFAFGIGYKRALSDYVEVFAEGLSRTYDNIAVHYHGGRYDGAKKDVQMDGTNLTVGFMFRF